MEQNLPQKIENLISEIQLKAPMHKKFLAQSLLKIKDEEIKYFELYLNFCEKSGLSISYLADCYLTILEDTITEQIYFNKHKKYRYDSFEAVAGHVYFDDDYMSRYMHGLAISGYFWINHLEIYRFFERTLPTNNEGRFLEIGPGHGNYMLRALQNCKYKSFTGVDISKTSIKMTDEILSHFMPEAQNKYDLKCMDFLDAELPYPVYDAIIMGEVLEHVERPDVFLKRINQISSKDTYVFITTCINAPAIDHIYLYGKVNDVEDQMKNCGFDIVESIILPYENKTIKECEEQLLSINVAYVLRKHD